MILRPIEGAVFKLRRANQHIVDLDGYLQKLGERRPPYSIRDQGGGWWEIKIDNPEPLPFGVPLILGDAIHNLRSGLDLLAGDVVRLNGQSAKGVHFPFANDGESLDQEIRRKNFIRASDAAVRLLKSMRPYNGGNVLLRGLHDLDLIDKHRLIIPTAKVLTSQIADFGPIMSGKGTVELSPEAVLTTRHHPDTFRGVLNARTVAVFGEDTPFAGLQVIETLESLSELVLGIIQAFEDLLLTEGNKPSREPGV